ncbi:Tetratricopeptide repeat protein 5 [Glycine max]|nr:Tetratricopeptide repeat protein 5 [Glycine max]
MSAKATEHGGMLGSNYKVQRIKQSWLRKAFNMPRKQSLWMSRMGMLDNLGNACLTSFFVTGAWDHTKLLHSLKAYQNAEKDESMKSNPDLFFNGATVNKYLENYQRALSGFEAAALKDPGLNAVEEVQKIVNLLDKVDNLLKGHVRAKRMASLASSLVAVDLKSSYRRVTIDLLSEGPNRALALEGKVFFFVRSESVAPLYYLLCDSNQSCFVLSIYGVRTDVIKEGDQLTLLDPYFRDVDLSWKEKRYQFKSIRLDFYEQVLVNGKALTPQQAIRTSIYAQHKP